MCEDLAWYRSFFAVALFGAPTEFCLKHHLRRYGAPRDPLNPTSGKPEVGGWQPRPSANDKNDIGPVVRRQITKIAPLEHARQWLPIRTRLPQRHKLQARSTLRVSAAEKLIVSTRISREPVCRAGERAAVQERVRSRTMNLTPQIKELQEAGYESLRSLQRGWKSVGSQRGRQKRK